MGLSDFCLPVLRTPFFVDNYFEKRGIRVFYAEERSTKNGAILKSTFKDRTVWG